MAVLHFGTLEFELVYRCTRCMGIEKRGEDCVKHKCLEV